MCWDSCRFSSLKFSCFLRSSKCMPWQTVLKTSFVHWFSNITVKRKKWRKGGNNELLNAYQMHTPYKRVSMFLIHLQNHIIVNVIFISHIKTLRFRRTLKNLPQTTTCKWKNQESSSVPLITKLKLFPVLLHNVTYNKKNRKQF